MKPGPVTKFDKRNTTMSKKFGNDAMLANCDIIVFLPIYGQFTAIRPSKIVISCTHKIVLSARPCTGRQERY